MQTGSGKDALNPTSVLVAKGDDGFLQDSPLNTTTVFLHSGRPRQGDVGHLQAEALLTSIS